MTKTGALAKARIMFGERATVEIDMAHFSPRLRYVHPTGEWSTLSTGTGRNWIDALHSAEYKENKRLGVWS